MHKRCYVYILANPYSRVLYTGMTCNLDLRLGTHRQHLIDGFTSKYNVTRLVYAEEHGGPLSAIAREKQIKKYRREKKIALIESINPEWLDLSTLG